MRKSGQPTSLCMRSFSRRREPLEGTKCTPHCQVLKGAGWKRTSRHVSSRNSSTVVRMKRTRSLRGLPAEGGLNTGFADEMPERKEIYEGRPAAATTRRDLQEKLETGDTGSLTEASFVPLRLLSTLHTPLPQPPWCENLRETHGTVCRHSAPGSQP